MFKKKRSIFMIWYFQSPNLILNIKYEKQLTTDE